MPDTAEHLGGPQFAHGEVALGVERVYRRKRVALTLSIPGKCDVLAYFTSQENADRFLAWMRGITQPREA